MRFGACALMCVLGLGVATAANGQVTPAQPSVPAAASASAATPMPLWPGQAPGALGTADDDIPTLAAYIPASNPTRSAVIIAPGGGYQHLSMQHEGSDVAEWLNAHGVAAFVLKYRLGMKYHNPTQLGDAQRAIRTVRSQAARYGVAADHIGMWGFSAGGHLTATAGTHFDSGNPSASDPIEGQSSRPDFLILAYPVITMLDPYVHKGSQKYLLGDTPSDAALQDMSDELHVTKDTPPTFLFSTTDDKTVPVMNSVLFYSALVKAGVPAEMHIFQHGAHGAGLAASNPQLSIWTDLLIKWMRERGYAAAQ